MRNFVYWNIYDKVFTVQNRETGRVRRHTPNITLRDVDFEIDQKERERMLRENRKTLHAGVRGEIIPTDPENLEGWTQVIYDPGRHTTFVTIEDEKPVFRAELVHMFVKNQRAQVYAKGLTYEFV
jgi:hypothetical protein